MKKLIDIPDKLLKELKILAAKNDTNLKNYIERVVYEDYQISKREALTIEAIEDGQLFRFVDNNLIDLFCSIDKLPFSFNDEKIEGEIDFYNFVIEICKWRIEIIKTDMEENPEDYEKV